MESSQILGFFKILSKSIKLVLKNAILIASLTTLSVTLESIVFLLFSFSYQTVSTYNAIIYSSSAAISFLQIIICPALTFAITSTFMLSTIAIAHVFGFATVTATAASYTDAAAKLSLPDLFSSVRQKWTSPFRFRKSTHGSRNPTMLHLVSCLAVAVALLAAMFNPNPVTITTASAVGVVIFVFQLYASVALQLAAVIQVVEDVGEAAEAVEKAGKLVEGLRLQGVMVKLLFNIVDLIVVVSFWMSVGDLGSLSLNVTAYALLYLNCASVTRIFVNVAYTVYYFRCKEYHHGHKMQLSGNLSPTALLLHDIP